MQAIPPEQWGIIVTAIIGIILALLAAIAFLIRWGVRYFASVQDEKLNAMRQEREIEKADFEARIKQRDREWELRLDETQSGRESNRLFFSELAETRKEDSIRFNAMQEAFRKQDETHLRQSQETIEVYRGIQSNTAATLELLKLHAENDNIMSIRQEKIMKQNDNTHEQLIDIASSLDAVIIKVDGLASGRISDKKILEDMRGALVLIQEGVKHLEDAIKPKFDETVDLSNGAKEITEANKEFTNKEESEQK